MSTVLGTWDVCSRKMETARGAGERRERVGVLQIADLEGKDRPRPLEPDDVTMNPGF